MYLKWWIVEQIIHLFGSGIFFQDLPFIGSKLICLYYTLMGANIGRNVKIHKEAKLGQYDLINIGDNVVIDNSLLRPFSLEEVKYCS
jgi:hypothetical protein